MFSTKNPWAVPSQRLDDVKRHFGVEDDDGSKDSAVEDLSALTAAVLAVACPDCGSKEGVGCTGAPDSAAHLGRVSAAGSGMSRGLVDGLKRYLESEDSPLQNAAIARNFVKGASGLPGAEKWTHEIRCLGRLIRQGTANGRSVPQHTHDLIAAAAVVMMACGFSPEEIPQYLHEFITRQQAEGYEADGTGKNGKKHKTSEGN